jgi:hypothetical protein
MNDATDDSGRRGDTIRLWGASGSVTAHESPETFYRGPSSNTIGTNSRATRKLRGCPA